MTYVFIILKILQKGQGEKKKQNGVAESTGFRT